MRLMHVELLRCLFEQSISFQAKDSALRIDHAVQLRARGYDDAIQKKVVWGHKTLIRSGTHIDLHSICTNAFKGSIDVEKMLIRTSLGASLSK